ANNEHQGMGTRFASVIDIALDHPEPEQVFAGCNVSDRADDWTQNYRCPDVAVFLAGNPAEDRGSHWLGGPDLAVEILSPGDLSRDKLDFYARVGVRELLLIDRDPWQLEMYRLQGKKLKRVGTSSVKKASVLASKVLQLSFRLVAGKRRPQVEIK